VLIVNHSFSQMELGRRWLAKEIFSEKCSHCGASAPVCLCGSGDRLGRERGTLERFIVKEVNELACV